MARRLPPLNALRAFEIAARHGNFSKAARELGVAQPAVTRHITNLEGWLGMELFVRSGNSVEVTSQGYEIAELVTSAFDRLELGLGQYTAKQGNEIVIGASFGITHLWLMPQITAMRDAAKGAAINFFTSENYADFEDSRVDFSIRFGGGDWPGKQADLLFSETAYVIAAPEFLERHSELDPDRLAETLKPEWLLEHGDPHNYGWMTWPRWFQHHGISPKGASAVPDVQNYPTLLDMVRCGDGIALGHKGLDDHLVDSGEVIRIGEPIHRPNLGYYLLTNANRSQSRAKTELCNHLISIFESGGSK